MTFIAIGLFLSLALLGMPLAFAIGVGALAGVWFLDFDLVVLPQRMKLVVNMIMGGMLSIFSEGMSLGQKANLDGKQILDIIDAGAMANPMFKVKGPMLLAEDYNTSFPLKHMQKDMRLAIDLGDKLNLTLPTAAIANEVYKQAKKIGAADEDIAAIYKTIK